METRASYILIGLFTLAVAVSTFGFVYWLSRYDDLRDTSPLIVKFETPVSGLLPGAFVYFNGIKAGEVDRIEQDPANPSVVAVYTLVQNKFPIKADTVASLGVAGLTGISFIDLQGGSPNAPAILGLGSPVLQAQDLSITNLIRTATTIAERADSVMNRVEGLIINNESRISNTLANVEAVSAAFAENREGIESFLQTVTQTGEDIRLLSGDLREIVQAVGPIVDAIEPEDVATTVSNAARVSQTLADNADALASQATGILTQVDTLIASTTPEVTGAINDVRKLTSVLAERSDDVSGLIANASNASASIAKAADEGEKLMAAARPVVETIDADALNLLLADASGAAKAANETLGSIRDFVGGVEEPLTKTIEDTQRITAGLADDVQKVGPLLNGALEATNDIKTALAGANSLIETAQPILRAIDPEMVGEAVTSVANVSDTLAREAELLTQGANTLIAGAARIITDNEPRIANILQNSENISGNIAQQSDALGPILEKVDRVVASAETASDEVAKASRKVGPILEAVDPERVASIVEGSASFAERLDQNSENIGQIIENVRGGVEQLPQITASAGRLLNSGEQVVDAIDPEAVTRILANIETATEGLPESFEKVNATIDGANLVVADIRSVTMTVAERREAIGQIVDDVSVISKELKDVANRVNGVVARVDGVVDGLSGDGLFTEIQAAAASVRSIATKFDRRSDEIANGLARFTTRGLRDAESLFNEARQAVRQAEIAIRKLETNPGGILFGGESVREAGGRVRR